MCGIAAILWAAEDAVPSDAKAAVLDLASRCGIARRGPDALDACTPAPRVALAASVLTMRASGDASQPATDADGNALCWNGEWFQGGPAADAADTRCVLTLLANATVDAEDASTAAARAADALAEHVRGPYALVFYCATARTLLYCRDPFGRRSLVVNGRRIASAPPRDGAGWTEVTTRGVHYDGGCAAWPRSFFDAVGWPPSGKPWSAPSLSAEDASLQLGAALSAAVARRCAGLTEVAVLFSGGIDSVVLARLASDALPADAAIDLVNVAFGERPGDANRAPDRLAARAALRELRAACPNRAFRLLEATAAPGALVRIANDVAALAAPCATHMDFNIAAALYVGARGEGVVYDGDASGDGNEHGLLRYSTDAPRETLPDLRADGGKCRTCGKSAKARCVAGLCGGCCRRKGRGDAVYTCGAHPKRKTYAEKCELPPPPLPVAVLEAKPVVRTRARALLLGMGADELLAGYARHRTAYKRGGVEELEREVNTDVARISTRNLGRDDRVTAAWGREARYPFLDEDVVRCIRLDLGAAVADLELPPGAGCKRALRGLARSLGLHKTATLAKRAIQFGTRIAPFSNRLSFGAARRGDGGAAFDVEKLVAGARRVAAGVAPA
jgi:asparagine synthetase B (glutamine-hydrolysing)